jgi:hypothetical protein
MSPLSMDSADNLLRWYYQPQVMAMLDSSHTADWFALLLDLPDPPDGVIDVRLDDEALTRVGEIRHAAGHWNAYADDAPELVLHRSDFWDEAADFLLAWPTLGAFQRAVTVEIAQAEKDIFNVMVRQIFGEV